MKAQPYRHDQQIHVANNTSWICHLWNTAEKSKTLQIIYSNCVKYPYLYHFVSYILGSSNQTVARQYECPWYEPYISEAQNYCHRMPPFHIEGNIPVMQDCSNSYSARNKRSSYNADSTSHAEQQRLSGNVPKFCLIISKHIKHFSTSYSKEA